MTSKIIALACVAWFSVNQAPAAWTEDAFAIESAGIRFGLDSNSGGENYLQAEVAVVFALPARWDLGRGWTLRPLFDVSLGGLWNGDDSAVIGAAGPVFSLSQGDFPVALELGVSPTLLSHHEFGSEDLGTPLQFTSHVGLMWRMHERLQVGYRYQHMSNANLDGRNPGVNLHMFSASYRF